MTAAVRVADALIPISEFTSSKELDVDFENLYSLENYVKILESLESLDFTAPKNSIDPMELAFCRRCSDLLYSLEMLDLDALEKDIDLGDLSGTRRVATVLDALSVLDLSILEKDVSTFDLTFCNRIYEVYNILNSINLENVSKACDITSQQVGNAKKAVLALDKLVTISNISNRLESANIEFNKLSAANAAVRSQLAAITEIVYCPIKGNVFYSDSDCIPIKD